MNINIQQIPISQIETGDYVSHTPLESLIQQYIDDAQRLERDMPDLIVSTRDDKYYVVGGFEVLAALKRLGHESIGVEMRSHETTEKEIELYQTLNGNSNVSQLVRAIYEMKKINSDYSFLNAVGKLTNHYYSRDVIQNYFENTWDAIPDDYLYDVYKDVLNEVESKSFYHIMFKPKLVDKIQKLNKHDTVDNLELLNKLDSNGYLTIYHGHVKPTLRNSHSWTLKPEVAHWFGRRNALFNATDDYYVFTGKVKLNDVIAYITVRKEEEIVVLNKNVKHKTKESFKRGENE